MQEHFLKENLCALISRPVRAHTRAQLRGNIGLVLHAAS